MADWKERHEVADSDDGDEDLDLDFADLDTPLVADRQAEKSPRAAETRLRTLSVEHVTQVPPFEDSTPSKLLNSSLSLVSAALEDDDSEDELALPPPRLNYLKVGDRATLEQLSAEPSQILRPGQSSTNDLPSRYEDIGISQEPRVEVAEPLSSSPLSSLTTTPREGTPEFNDAGLQEPSVNRDSVSVSVVVPELSNGNFLADNPRAYGPARSLRRRNAIQLNPYRVEDAIYRQLSRAAGLAPIRMNRLDSKSGEDTQDYVPLPERESQLAANSFNDSQAEETQNSNTVQDFTVSPSLSGDRGWPAGRGQKRRRLNNRRSIVDMGILEDNSIGVGTQRSPEPLLSPPSSGTYTEHPELPTKKSFRYPPGLTPPQLQTPAVSSEMRSRRPIILSDEPNDENELLQSDNAALPLPSSHNQDGASETESGSETEVLSVRRKIKGVLPASWLRIDLKNQTSTQSGKHRSANPLSPSKLPRLGVARPVAKRKDHPRAGEANTPTAFIIPDDTSSEEDSAATVAKVVVDPLPTDALMLVPDADSDSMEEDFIDPMISAVPRGASSSLKQRRQQQKGRGLFKRSRDRNSDYIQPKISKHLNRSKRFNRRRSTVPNLSILDAFDSSRAADVPDFIRIALRTTNKRKDRGRHSPSSKYMRLSTRDQTAELEETVFQWRQGNIRQRTLPPVSTNESMRTPLVPLSGNDRMLPHPAERQSNGYSHRTQRKRQTTLHDGFRRPVASAVQPLRKENKEKQQPKPSQRKMDRERATNVHHRSIALPAILEVPKRLTFVRDEVRRSSHTPTRLFDGESALRAGPHPILEKFLQQPRTSQAPAGPDEEQDQSQAEKLIQPRKYSRKRKPRQTLPSFRMSTKFETLETSQPDTLLLADTASQGMVQEFSGLEAYGSEYTLDFDVVRFPSWFLFSSSTLLRNGIVCEVLSRDWSQDLFTRRPPVLVELAATVHYWSSWNEAVVSDLDRFGAEMASTLHESNINCSKRTDLSKSLDSLISYLLNGISFLDAVDRQGCVRTFISFLTRIAELYSAELSQHETSSSGRSTLLPELCRVLLLSHQNFGLVQHSLLDPALKAEAKKVHQRLLVLASKCVFKDGVSHIVQFQQCVANCSTEASSLTAKNKAEVLVILIHTSNRNGDETVDFWDLLVDTVPFQLLHSARNARTYERKWFHLFAVLPFLDIEADGTLSQPHQSCNGKSRWQYVEQLLSPFLQANHDELNRHQFSVYCCSMFRRCYVLATAWNWTSCESVLRVMYDFFARNNLRNLPTETPNGHPGFLENPNMAKLVPNDKDTTYQVFLKLLGTAVLYIKDIYPEKKMRSIIFRFTPNHSRSLPKHEAVAEEDLEALRNHHSLLSMLYQVSPVSCRPRLDLIRELIRVEDSHRQACHISIRTWTDLTLFHLVKGDATNEISALIAWLDDIISQLVQQHSAARKEVEEHSFDLPLDIRDSTIASNQFQVEAVLSDALESLLRVLSRTHYAMTLENLLIPRLANVLELFDANTPRINQVLEKALLLFQRFCTQATELSVSQDSQEYGDWSAFDDMVPAPASITLPLVPEPLQRSLRGLLSNALGAGSDVGESFMTTLLQTWTDLASYQVSSAVCSWTDFVDMYGKHAWQSFGESDRKTKYTPLFFAMIIEKDQDAYDLHKLSFLRSWIASLAERESQIKYQGRLTSAILNRDIDNVLLDNPPFSRAGSPLIFRIQASELADRRLSLVSCILSNMWQAHQSSIQHNLSQTAEQKHEYAELLKLLMRNMKDNFIALGRGGARQGAYVDFVQAVVSLMQQYTKDLCPIDRFFTDSNQFPLPVHDPNYLVGRLKGYSLRLSDGPVHKQLATFVLSSIERAVLDIKQEYLIGQLQCSMLDAFGDGRQETNLRGFFAHSIVPAYTSVALSTSCGWLLAAPLMEAHVEVYEHILFDVDGASERSVSAAVDNMTCVMSAIQSSLQLLVDHPGHLELPHVVRMIQIYYAVACAALSPLDYCMRLQPIHCGKVLAQVSYLRSFAVYAWSHIDGRPDALAPLDNVAEISLPTGSDDFQYAAAGLNATLSSKWMKVGDTYEMRGSAGTRIVHTDLESLQQETSLLAEQLLLFYRALQRLPSFDSQSASPESAWDASLVMD